MYFHSYAFTMSLACNIYVFTDEMHMVMPQNWVTVKFIIFGQNLNESRAFVSVQSFLWLLINDIMYADQWDLLTSVSNVIWRSLPCGELLNMFINTFEMIYIIYYAKIVLSINRNATQNMFIDSVWWSMILCNKCPMLVSYAMYALILKNDISDYLVPDDYMYISM